MYIKNNEWEKMIRLEQIDKLLKRVENKQLKNIEKWTDAKSQLYGIRKITRRIYAI